jgi:hypothetical protein
MKELIAIEKSRKIIFTPILVPMVLDSGQDFFVGQISIESSSVKNTIVRPITPVRPKNI